MSAPGWYPDPSNPQRQIYWDGAGWVTNPAAAAAFPAPTVSQPSVGTANSNKRWIGLAIIAAFVVLVVGVSISESGTPTDELHIPSVRDGKFEFTLLTWNGHAGKLRIVNIGDRSWSYSGDNHKAVDAQDREFDCEGESRSDLQPGDEFIDTVTCRNGSVAAHHLEVHDSWLSGGAEIYLPS